MHLASETIHDEVNGLKVRTMGVEDALDEESTLDVLVVTSDFQDALNIGDVDIRNHLRWRSNLGRSGRSRVRIRVQRLACRREEEP